MLSVRGMGVAVSVRTSTSVRRAFNFSLQQTLRGDDDVHGAGGDAGDDTRSFFVGAKARQALDAYRPIGEAVGEGGVVLLREQGGRHQDGHLLAGLNGDKRGAQGDLGLAEADIATDQAVHRSARGQIGQYVADGV